MQKPTNLNLKNIMQGLFLVLVFSLTIYYVFRGEDMHQIARYLSKANAGYWYLGVVFVLGFIISESVVIYYLFHSIGEKLKFTHCCLYSFVGFFVSAITPSASGGQPAQIYFMKKDKIAIATSSLLLMIVTITYKAVLVILGIGVLIIQPKSVMIHLKPVEMWIYLGIILNIFCVAGMLLLVFKPILIQKILNSIIYILEKNFHWKKADKWRKRIDSAVSRYANIAEFFIDHKRVVLNAFIITFVQRILLFMVTWFVYLSFHLDGASMQTIVLLQGMVSVAVDMLPLPGGMGISENLFLQIFKPLCGKELLVPLLVVSRGISYYTQVIICGIMSIVAYFVFGRDNSKE